MSEKMKIAIVTGIFTIIVAVIGGLFLIVSALIEGGIIITGPGVQVGNPQAEIATPISTTSIQASSLSSNSLCPTTISRGLVEEWRQVGETSKTVTQNYINEFDTMRFGGEFKPQDVLPAGVLIITDFGSGESLIYQQYPVRPIVHYRSWGVFETTGEYTAIQYGACMSIAP